MKVWNLLQNGMGGIDWSGFDLAVAMYEIEDVEMLIENLLVVKGHKKPEDDAPPKG